jgi:hypothetical protein
MRKAISKTVQSPQQPTVAEGGHIALFFGYCDLSLENQAG